jgi:hypothetical protein
VKVLVDECVPLKLVRLLTGHTLGSVMNLARSFSVRVMRWQFDRINRMNKIQFCTILSEKLQPIVAVLKFFQVRRAKCGNKILDKFVLRLLLQRHAQ